MSEPSECAASDADANGYQQPCSGKPWIVVLGVAICFEHWWRYVIEHARASR